VCKKKIEASRGTKSSTQCEIKTGRSSIMSSSEDDSNVKPNDRNGGSSSSSSSRLPLLLVGGGLSLVALVLAYLYFSASSNNTTLTTKNAALTAQVATLTSQNATLTSQNATLTSQNSTLTTQNATLTSQNTGSAAQVASLTTSNAGLAYQLKTETTLATTQAATITQMMNSNVLAQAYSLTNFISGIYKFDTTKWNNRTQSIWVNLSFIWSQPGASVPAVYVCIWTPPMQSVFTIISSQLPAPTLNIGLSGNDTTINTALSTNVTPVYYPWACSVISLNSLWTNNGGSLVFSASSSNGAYRVFSTDGSTICITGSLTAGPTTTLNMTGQVLTRYS
jgi:hypothetical protein